jgi:hypothetical protein
VISDQAHISLASKEIELFEKDPKQTSVTPPAEPPDGPPIGADEDQDFWPNSRDPDMTNRLGGRL